MSTIFSYLEHQDQASLMILYGSPWCTIAVLQYLPALGRHIVFRLLTIKGPVTEDFIHQWFKSTSDGTMHQKVNEAINYLKSLSILGSPSEPVNALGLNGTERTVKAVGINLQFAQSLETALSGDEEVPWQEATERLNQLYPLSRSLSDNRHAANLSSSSSSSSSQFYQHHAPTLHDIERYAAGRWNAILHFLVGTFDAPPPEMKVVELLISTGLLAFGSGRDPFTGALLDNDDDDEEEKKDNHNHSNDNGTLNDGSNASSSSSSSSQRSSRSRSMITFQEMQAQQKNGPVETHITRAGYEFLLKDTSVQMWTFMSEYLNSAESRGMQITDILQFLLELGLCRIGDGYALHALTSTQKILLEDFQSFGLVYVPKFTHPGPKKDPSLSSSAMKHDPGASTLSNDSITDTRRFYPTSLAVILTQPDNHRFSVTDIFKLRPGAGPSMPIATSSNPSFSLMNLPSSDVHLYVIVEKNFKIYAYTSLDLHIALLALFASIEVRLPNLVVGVLSRRSVLTAYERGIRAKQIIHFLRQRIHPIMDNHNVNVPENVIDQLFLWQEERHRVNYKPGILITSFENITQYREVVQYAQEIQCCEYTDETSQSLIVNPNQIELMRNFMRSRGLRGINTINK